VVSESTTHFSNLKDHDFKDHDFIDQSFADQNFTGQPPNQLDQLEPPPSTSVGTHCLLELYDCPAHILNDLDLIEESLRCAAQVACSTLLSLTSKAFQPQGVTALALLAESHISIHTWPETGYAAVDVFTCGEHTRPQRACEYLAVQMQSQSHAMTKLFRRGHLPAFSERASSEQAVVSTA
jgi:S-adenosylmethionine decarboxylase